jgi:hypothetical protein
MLSVLLCGAWGRAQEVEPPVSVRLFATDPEVCTGQPFLELNVVVTNGGEKALTFSPDGKWNAMIITRYLQNQPRESQNVLEEVEPHTWTSIGPGQSVVLPLKLQLTGNRQIDPAMFSRPGISSIQIGFGLFQRESSDSPTFRGTIRSNKAFIVLRECAHKPG